MYAVAHVVLQERPDVLVLPLSAVIRAGKETSCWTVQDARAVRTSIAVGLQVGSEVEVTSGLKGDEAVVQSQGESLREGQAIETSQPSGG